MRKSFFELTKKQEQFIDRIVDLVHDLCEDYRKDTIIHCSADIRERIIQIMFSKEQNNVSRD